MAWRLAKSLIKLRDQVNAAAPNRSKASDGSIGDAAHASRTSDHNPWLKDAKGVGVVSAIDVTHDQENGMNGRALADALTNDHRTKYIIFDGRIWKAKTGQWESYHGPNSHRHHVHISVKPATYDDDATWRLNGMSVPVTPKRPVLKRGDRGPQVEELQRKLRKELDVHVDGIFGAETERLLKVFQRIAGLDADGIAGPATYRALGL